MIETEIYTEPRSRGHLGNCLRASLWLIILGVFVTGGLSAQSTAAEIETLLQVNAVTYAQAARFILDAANVITTTDYEQAFNYANEQGWLPRNAAADNQARLDTVAFIGMHAFDMRGGLFYTLWKKPLHAYRELVYRRIIQGRADPAMTVSGERLMFIINRLLADSESVSEAERQRRQERANTRNAGDTQGRHETLAEEIADTTLEN